MASDKSDELGRRAAEFARAAARRVRESGVPLHRERALAKLMIAEISAMFDRELKKLAETIEASPDRYSVNERKEMMRKVLADGMVRVDSAIDEQIAAWKLEGLGDRTDELN